MQVSLLGEEFGSLGAEERYSGDQRMCPLQRGSCALSSTEKNGIKVGAGDDEQDGPAPVTETVVVLAATEEQLVGESPTVGQVLGYAVDVTVTTRLHEVLVDIVCDVEVVAVAEDVIVTRQEHAELTREGEFLH
ncbi:hypothetical protein N431DRAFT_442548 [Stipitochalara longipes BDJ]|nr:hypothetical protein N431DRAFT_442548 [Stipitochalara longipes BDJ]